MRIQDIVSAFFILILVYLLVINWKGTNALLTTGGQTLIGTVKTLQGR